MKEYSRIDLATDEVAYDDLFDDLVSRVVITVLVFEILVDGYILGLNEIGGLRVFAPMFLVGAETGR